MTHVELTAALLRRAAADFLAVAPARAPRVANPDPAVVSALFHLIFWHGVSNNHSDAESTAASFAARIGEGFYSKYPKDWQYLRDIAARYAA